MGSIFGDGQPRRRLISFFSFFFFSVVLVPGLRISSCPAIVPSSPVGVAVAVDDPAVPAVSAMVDDDAKVYLPKEPEDDPRL
jgi:hypothetical protein